MKSTQASYAIKFTCAYCESIQCIDDVLEEIEIDGQVVRSAIVDCQACSHENKLILGSAEEDPGSNSGDEVDNSEGC